ncbi:MAG: hypothetical protein AAGK22_09820 [Acidobacteriota bacterium]
MKGNWTSRAAATAFVGGLVNLLCDVLLTPGPGPGSALATPSSVATVLAGTPVDRLALATLLGAMAISTWVLATPALVRLVLPAGRDVAAAVALLNVLAVGQCVSFHVATGCLGWVGRLAPSPAPAVLAPFWQLLQGGLGVTFVALAAALALAAWRSREVPRWLPFASPLVSMSVLAMPARAVPGPFGLTLALAGSTAGATLWLLALWLTSRESEH